MKRCIIWVLLLALLAPSALADGNRVLEAGMNGYFQDMVSDGETLYLVGDDGLYAWRKGDDEPTRWDVRLRLSDDPDAAEDTDLYQARLFAGESGLCGAQVVRDEDTGLNRLVLFDLAFTDSGVVEAANVRALELPDGLRDCEYFDPNGICVHEGRLYLLGWTDESMALAVLDTDNPRGGAVLPLESWGTRMIATPDGPLLAEEVFDQEAAAEQTRLSQIGPDGALTERCLLPFSPTCLAADPESGALYAVYQGKSLTVDPETGALGEPFGVLPVEPERATAMGSLYAAQLGDRVALVDATGSAEGTTLTISSPFTDDWLRKTVLDYSLEHPEVAPVLISEDSDTETVLEAMLTQSPQPDIFMLYTTQSACQALLDRGFALPLEGERAQDLAARLYPGLREGLTRGGALVALPLREDCMGMGVSPRLLEKLGLSEQALPQDWMGFFDFLENDIKPNLSALGPNELFTYDDMTVRMFHDQLFTAILQGYIHACQAAGRMPDYESPALVAPLERLDALDFTEYGLKEGDEFGYGYSSENDYLIQFDDSMDFTESMLDSAPLALGFGDDLPGALAMEMQVAIVNPFSAHADLAAAFLDALVEKLPEQTLYALCPDLNEPVRQPDMDESVAYFENALAEGRASLEAAQPADRQIWEDQLAMAQREYDAYLDRTSWLISPQRLEWFRAQGERVSLAWPSWFDQDGNAEAWDLLNQYMGGQLPVREFLAAVNRKARMMAMEG